MGTPMTKEPGEGVATSASRPDEPKQFHYGFKARDTPPRSRVYLTVSGQVTARRQCAGRDTAG